MNRKIIECRRNAGSRLSQQDTGRDTEQYPDGQILFKYR